MSREEVLQALLTVFRERGFEGATITEIARATGLGKASLYHHFPGGKEEMTESLVRVTLSDLNARTFAPLYQSGPPKARLIAILEGWNRYVDDGEQNCLLAVLVMGTARDRVGGMISEQLNVWINGLAALFQDAGQGQKPARRNARDFIAQLQGGLVLARLLGQPKRYRQAARRLAKDLDQLPD